MIFRFSRQSGIALRRRNRHHLLLFLFSLPLWASGNAGPFHFVEIIQQTPMNLPIYSGDSLKRYIIDVNGNGCVWFDFNNDGLMDLFLTQGATFAALQGADRKNYSNHLFINLGNGKFRDATDQAGAGGPPDVWAMGAIAGDYDADGWTDLFVTYLGEDLLYRNNGGTTFRNVTLQAGLTSLSGWSTGASFGDYDGDGYLDLYVPGYVNFDLEHPPAPACPYKGMEVMCGPGGLRAAPDFLFRNRGDGTFEDVTAQALLGKEFFDSYGFGAVFVDLNDDNLLDLYVANDLGPNYLYRNNGNGTFTEVGFSSGAAYAEDGRAQASMGIAIGDYNRDGRPDILVTNFSDDYDTLYRNEGDLLFSDVSREVGLREVSLPFLGWACMFADFDGDGWEDLFVANGHVYPQVATLPGGKYWQRNLLYRNLSGRTFQEAGLASGLTEEALSRGGAVADFDNDGDPDLFIVNMDSVPSFLENRSRRPGNWVGLAISRPFGSKVKITSPSGDQFRFPVSGGSYLSQNDPRVLVGLGKDTVVESVEVQWPGGERLTLKNLEVNRYHRIPYPGNPSEARSRATGSRP
ncbi:MAG: CRTAC1 family protein [Acidobacteriota bacterium]